MTRTPASFRCRLQDGSPAVFREAPHALTFAALVPRHRADGLVGTSGHRFDLLAVAMGTVVRHCHAIFLTRVGLAAYRQWELRRPDLRRSHKSVEFDGTVDHPGSLSGPLIARGSCHDDQRNTKPLRSRSQSPSELIEQAYTRSCLLTQGEPLVVIFVERARV